MARGVNQVDLVGDAIVGLIGHAHCAGLDRDPLFALQIHAIQQLLLHLALGHGTGRLQQAIRQCRFAVVDMRDDAEISDKAQGIRLIRAGGFTCSYSH